MKEAQAPAHHRVAGVLILLNNRLGPVIDDLLAGHWTERDLLALAEQFEGIARDMRQAAADAPLREVEADTTLKGKD